MQHALDQNEQKLHGMINSFRDLVFQQTGVALTEEQLIAMAPALRWLTAGCFGLGMQAAAQAYAALQPKAIIQT